MFLLSYVVFEWIRILELCQLGHNVCPYKLKYSKINSEGLYMVVVDMIC